MLIIFKRFKYYLKEYKYYIDDDKKENKEDDE